MRIMDRYAFCYGKLNISSLLNYICRSACVMAHQIHDVNGRQHFHKLRKVSTCPRFEDEVIKLLVFILWYV